MTSQEVRQQPGTESRFFYGYVIVSLAFLILMVIGGTHYTFGVFFKPLIGDFGWTKVSTSGAFSLYMIVLGLLSILVGRLNDRFGPRVVMSVGSFFLGLGYLLMSQTSAIWHLYLFYGVIIGAGTSGLFIPPISAVARWFIKRRGLMNGIVLAGIGVGTMIMPPLASWIISNYGWRTSYVVIGFMILAVIISAAQFLRRDPGQKRQLPYGQNEVTEENLNSKVSGFSLQEAMLTQQFWLLCAVYLVVNIFLQAIMVHIIPHATEVGISTAAAANIFIGIGGLSIAGRITLGSASDRIGSKSGLIICFILTTAALAWLLVAKEMWMFYLFAAVFGFAYGGIVAMQSPLVANLFGLRSHGAIFGITISAFTFGGAIGPVLAGGIFDIRGSYYWAFLACIVISVIGLVLTTLLKPTKRS